MVAVVMIVFFYYELNKETSSVLRPTGAVGSKVFYSDK